MTSGPIPKVSVIIPVHNTGRFLQECLDSVFAQTLSPELVEVIAVDDGSSDDSLEILNRNAKEHENLRVIHQEASGSAARPRNVGIDVSRGEYLFFLDSDDHLDPDTLKGLVDLADETGSGIVLPRMTSFGSDRARASTFVKRTVTCVDYVSSRAYRTASATKLFRASIVRDHEIRFPTGFRRGEDLSFTYAVGLLSPHVSMLGDKPYYYARWRDDNTSIRQNRQPVEEVLLKSLTAIRTIVRWSDDPKTRIALLQRSVLGRGGVWRAFTHPHVDEWDEDRRREAFQEAHQVLADAWEPSYRRGGTLEAYVVSSLIRAGDYAGTMDAARQLAEGGLRLRTRPWSRSSPRFVSSTRTVVRDAVETYVRKPPTWSQRQRRLLRRRLRRGLRRFRR